MDTATTLQNPVPTGMVFSPATLRGVQRRASFFCRIEPMSWPQVAPVGHRGGWFPLDGSGAGTCSADSQPLVRPSSHPTPERRIQGPVFSPLCVGARPKGRSGDSETIARSGRGRDCQSGLRVVSAINGEVDGKSLTRQLCPQPSLARPLLWGVSVLPLLATSAPVVRVALVRGTRPCSLTTAGPCTRTKEKNDHE